MSDYFELLPEDIEYLGANYQGRWHKLAEGSGKHGLIIKGFRIPAGFIQSVSDLMVLVPSGYPASPLDMFYFDPPLATEDGADAGALSIEQHFGRHWQRWSRHYEWRMGEDDLCRHIEYVSNELQRSPAT